MHCKAGYALMQLSSLTLSCSCIFMMYIVGTIPSIEEANRREGIVTLPWQEKSLELGMFQSLGAICVYFLFKYLTAYITNSKSGSIVYCKAGSHCVLTCRF